MAQGDIYELTDVQRLYGQTVYNVYYYRQDLVFLLGLPTTAQVVLEAWQAQKLLHIQNIQSTDLVHTEIRVRNLFDATDAFSKSVSVTGLSADTGGTMSAFNAWAFVMEGDNASVRDGAKRIAGVVEAHQADGVFNADAAIVGLFNQTATRLEGALEIGTLITSPVFLPVVVARNRTGVPGSYQYNLPQTQVTANWSNIVNVLWKALITSQTSRKVGVGI